MARKFILFTLVMTLFLSCNTKKEEFQYIKITTEKGDIIVKLYNVTPKHRDNIVKLANEKFFDGQIFHRIIKNFVVQGGDPTTKEAKPDSIYGNGGPGYDIDAEIIDTIYHKRGALGMAREGDDVNPERKSSGSQFYIVTGKIFTDLQLNELENKLNTKKKANLYKKLIQQKINESKSSGKVDTISISLDVSAVIDSIYATYPKIVFSKQQRKLYTTVGGIPHLDNNYTVFGEVVSGMGAVDVLSEVQTDGNDRPLKDTRFSISVIKQ